MEALLDVEFLNQFIETGITEAGKTTYTVDMPRNAKDRDENDENWWRHGRFRYYIKTASGIFVSCDSHKVMATEAGVRLDELDDLGDMRSGKSLQHPEAEGSINQWQSTFLIVQHPHPNQDVGARESAFAQTRRLLAPTLLQILSANPGLSLLHAQALSVGHYPIYKQDTSEFESLRPLALG